jgi:tRNA(Ile)-lysidine synthase
MAIQQRFCQYISENKLFSLKDKVLLAVSGGMDSVAMCQFFHKAGNEFAIAHCNFGLRGEDSDEDENFVKKLARKYKVPFYVQLFDAKAFAEKEKISTQMAARELRYAWFSELIEKENYAFVASAHHQNDILETVLLNLTKGTGIAGLHGIKPKNGNVVRPLLFATREDIREYVAQEQLAWREDSSNESNKYQRNLLRNEVIPLLKKLNPNLENTMRQTVEKVEAAEKIVRDHIENIGDRVMKEESGVTFLDFQKLTEQKENVLVLFELLKSFGFSYPDSRNIWEALKGESGKRFESPTHSLVKDRTELVITGKNLKEYMSLDIENEEGEISNGIFKLDLKTSEREAFSIPASKDIAVLDLEKITFPLQLRKWKEGDWFCPLGMNKKKKLSDFLIDNKVPLNIKDKIWVLTSKGSIIWIPGYRIDERYKVTDKTKKLLVIRKEDEVIG